MRSFSRCVLARCESSDVLTDVKLDRSGAREQFRPDVFLMPPVIHTGATRN